MNYGVLLRTLRHLKLKQILFQLKNRSITPKFVSLTAPTVANLTSARAIEKYNSLNGGTFTFINLNGKFNSWNDSSLGMLWTYNLNYMDYINQPDIPFEESEKWIDKFIEELPQNKVGLDPYPIALRGINWIKFVSSNFDKIEEEKLMRWNNSLYSQYVLLSKKLEYHLLGNHLLEDAYSLFIGALYFRDIAFFKKSAKLLLQELEEQTLPDGANYEQSPMYHCILLDRLLDCCNFSFANTIFQEQKSLNNFLKQKATSMLGHLESIIYTDGKIPLLNDSAREIAPSVKQIFDYAKRIGLVWNKVPMRECGYRKMELTNMEAIIDVGNITATYQAGHSHADTFNYELRINGKPFVVDTGISTYNKTPRRQLERGTSAHNTVSIDNKNSSEVWGGFRVANRAKVSIIKDEPTEIEALHTGFGKDVEHRRIFKISENSFKIEDIAPKKHNAISYIHFASDVKILSLTNTEIITDCAVICICGASEIDLIDGKVSEQYNKFLPSKIAKILFRGNLSYEISGR